MRTIFLKVGAARARSIGAGLVGVLVVLFVIAAGGYAWIGGVAGRAWLGETIENAFDAEARGTLRVGRILEVHGFSVVAEDVAFVDPRGHDVIAIRDARLGIAPFGLLGGKIRLRAATARGVVVHVVPGRRNSTSIEDAFEGRGGSGESPGTDLDTSAIRVREGRVRIAMGGPPVLLHSLRGVVRVVLPLGGQVRVSFARFSGRFELPRFQLFTGRSFRTLGWIHGGASPVLEFRLRACAPRGTMPIRVRYSPGRLGLRFDARDNRLAGLIVGTIATFSPTIRSSRGAVDLDGVGRC